MPFSIQKASTIHQNFYDYSKVVYTGVYNKIEIVCPAHGSFFQTPKNHIWAKAGCKQCSNDRIRGTFAAETAHTVHQHKYDYSKVDYVTVDTKVEIVCPDHGSFFQTPDKHINAKTGCPRCKGSNMSVDRRMSTAEFVAQANKVHSNRYDYSEAVLINFHTKIRIKCPIHGLFLQVPNNHIHQPNGCPQCGYNVSASGARWVTIAAPTTVIREHVLHINNRKYKVDGYDPSTNTIYEYFGVFWHGCPSYTDHTKVNPRNGVPFKTLYEKTIARIETFKAAGFNLVYEWGK